MPAAQIPYSLSSGSQTLRRQSFDRCMCWDADLPSELVERIWHAPHALTADGINLQDKPRCTVVRLDHAAGPFVWKHHNWGSFGRTVRRSLNRSVARKAWLDGHFLHAAGIPTPRPRALLERRFGPFQTCSYLLCDYIVGTSLYRFMRFGDPTDEVLRHLAQQVAAIWQRLDDLHVSHNDFKTENLLVDPRGKIWVIDLDRMRRLRRVDRLRRKQVRDAADLLHPRNWRSNPAAAEVFRAEILRTSAAKAALAGPLGVGHPLGKPVPTTNRPSQLVTVLIPCRNAEETISACLESVRDMADEILVADAGSTDDTLRLAREFGGCRIIQRPCDDEAAFEAWAHQQAQHPWILRIRPGELLNSELGRQVQDTIATEPSEDGFHIFRHVYFRGRRLRFGGFQHDASLRLYRKDAARFEMREGRLEVTVASQKTGRIVARMRYESCPNVDQYLQKLIRRSKKAAKDAQRQGLRPLRRRVLWQVPWQFVRSYILRWGWFDGWAGLHACSLSALAVYLREAMLWEMNQPAATQRPVERDDLPALWDFDPEVPPSGTSEKRHQRPAA